MNQYMGGTQILYHIPRLISFMEGEVEWRQPGSRGRRYEKMMFKRHRVLICKLGSHLTAM